LAPTADHERILLTEIPVALPVSALAERLRVVPESGDHDDLTALVRDATALARPRALARLAYIDELDDEHAIIGGVRLDSRVLSVNLKGIHRVFVQVATCGVELAAWSDSLQDVLWRYWAEEIKVEALGCAIRAIAGAVQERFQPGKLSSMSPGSLASWPIQQQRPLFRILGDVEAQVGVTLTPSMLMVPNKSVSRLAFATDTDFVSCALCPRDTCPGRRAPYDPTLYERRYRPASS
jgi:hypothetical protein